jgi:hypothetical protein
MIGLLFVILLALVYLSIVADRHTSKLGERVKDVEATNKRILEAIQLQVALNADTEKRFKNVEAKGDTAQRSISRLATNVNDSLSVAQHNDAELLAAIKQLAEKTAEHSLLLIPEKKIGHA